MLALLPLILIAQIEPPVLKRFVEAEYPASALAATSEAVVGVEIVISDAGLVDTATVVESAGADFDAAAMDAVLRFEFEPARLDGEPIPVRILYRYRFTVQQVAPPPVANLTGVVVDRWERHPLPGVTIDLLPSATSTQTTSSTITDDLGRFCFVGLSTGAYALRLSGPDMVTVTTTHEVREGVAAALELGVERTVAEEEELDIEIDDEEIVRAPSVRKRAVETRIESAQATVIPGTQGDTVKVVQNLPGVARSAAGSGDLIIWGASGSNTRAYVDGIVTPRVFHTGGVRSTIGPELVEAIELAPGGYGPRWGRAVGGLVSVQTKSLSSITGVHGHVAADVLDGSASVSAKLADGVWAAAAGRYSWLDHTFGNAVDESARALVPIPRYWDYQAKLQLAPGVDDELAVLAFGSGDDVERTSNLSDPSSASSEQTFEQYHRVGAVWRRARADGSTIEVTPWLGTDHHERIAKRGDVPATETRTLWRGGLTVGDRLPLASWLRLAWGVDLEVVDAKLSRDGSVTEPPREGDVRVFGAPFDDRTNGDRWSVVLAGRGLGRRLAGERGPVESEPGRRLDTTVVDGDRAQPPRGDEPVIGFSDIDVALDPRLEIRWRAAQWLAIEAAAGLYTQPPDPAELSSVFGNPRLEPAHGQHFLLATKLEPIERLELEVTGFFTRLDQLATRSAQPSPPIAKATEAHGQGRTFGMQAFLRYAWEDVVFGWVSYTLMRSERRDTPDSAWRLFDGDQTHVLAAVASWNIGAGFSAGARFRYATGFARTPVTGAYFNARDGLHVPTYGTHNSERMPEFMQLDLRVAWRREFAPVTLSVYLDVQNVTNRANPEEVIYTSDFSRQGYVTGLPLLPVLGLKAEL